MSTLLSVLEFEYLNQCPLCGASSEEWDERIADAVSWGVFMLYRLCNECGIMFQNPQVTEESSMRSYVEDVYRHTTDQIDSGASEMEARIQQIRAHRIIQICKMEGILPTRHLDVGSALGILSYLTAKEFECDVWGVEPAEEYRGMAEKFNDEVETSLTFVPSLDDVEGAFDSITLIHVLEHVYNPIEYLKQIKGLLAEGGQLIIEVPHGHRTIGMSIWHPFVFITKTLEYVLDEAGFENYKTQSLKSFFTDQPEVAYKDAMPSEIAIITNSPREEEPAPE